MGSIFARILSVFTQQITTVTQTIHENTHKRTQETQTVHKSANKRTRGTQTAHKSANKRTQETQTVHKSANKRTRGTQTITKFTEKLTNFDTVDLGSTETFDQACDICDLYTEKEAVGHCCVCEQYMCYICCKHHEKIHLSQNHTIIGKDEFGKLTGGTSLFDNHLIPLTKGSLPRCVHTYSKCDGCAIFITTFPYMAHDVNNICYLSRKDYSMFLSGIELGTISKSGKYQKISISKTDSETQSFAIKHFVVRGLSDIWSVAYFGRQVYYKNVFTASGACYDVVAFDNGLALSVHIETGFSLPDWQIQYVDYRGNLKMQIYYDSQGKQLFKEPKHLASNDSEDILFVSDIKRNCVIALDPKGNVIYKFTDDKIKSPKGLTCDEENNVYVACTSEVIQIDKYGKKCRVLLDSQSKDIMDLCYYKPNRRLAVIESSKTVTIFTFLP